MLLKDEIRPVWLEINLDNLENNIKEIRRHVGNDTLIMAIVKANAYGHGAEVCAKLFLKNGADRLGVSILSEGIALREAGIEAPILLLNFTPISQYKKLLKYDLTQTIFKYEDALALSEEAVKQGKIAKIHIKIDSGMNRIGFLPNEDSIKSIINISKLPNLEVEGIFTHFATADESDKSYTKKQFERFNNIINKLEEEKVHIPIKHSANSATIVDLPDYKQDMVRPGIILYGHYPSEFVNSNIVNLKPAMSLKSTISYVKELDKGEGIGYGQTYITKKKSRIATLPIGYGDGYSRNFSNRAYVSINNKRVPIIGNICMDQLMVDVTDINELDLKDQAVLFGYSHESIPNLKELAKIIGTINYEILTMINSRVPRLYL